ncbi:three-helix bundle dimerization domain-containing protein [Actinoplanes sp. NPDC049118]|uniref:three-helix bundle dimerization domain-containing protein n=1 Tax=Actinoplanes sp. NPDC049118 TaxID=3155769 RepID=UPI0033F5EE48
MTEEDEVEGQTPDAEHEAVRQVVTTMRQRFPGLADSTVTGYVTDIHRRFNAAPVRDFVPLLVEREAQRALTVLATDSIPAPGQGPR